MKTQLLEDIGQSTSSLASSSKVAHSIRDKAGQALPAQHSLPRAGSAVWRQKPPGEPVSSTRRELDRQTQVGETPRALAAAPDGPMAAASLPNQAEPPVAPPFDAQAPSSGAARPDPVFDFCPRLPPPPAQGAASAEPSWFQRSGQRYLLWGTWMLLAALVLQAGWWLYGERKDAGSLQLVAEEFKSEPRQERALRRRALAAKEFTLAPDGEVRVSPAPAATSEVPAVRPSPAIPPLAVLAPETDDGTSPEPEVAGTDGGVQQEGSTIAEQDATPKPQPAPKQIRQSQGEQSASDDKSALAAVEPAPHRRVARASAKGAGKTVVQDASMAETLKACRAHGYHAAQCIKRACRVTKYGFACRGR